MTPDDDAPPYDPTLDEPDLDEPEADAPPRPPTPIRRGLPALYDTDAEAALLGTAMLSGTAADHLAAVDPAAFGDPAHGHIAHAIQQLHAQSQPTTAVSVKAHLANHQLLELAGGQAKLISLQADPAPTSGARRYADIVRQLAALRRLQLIGSEISAMATQPGSDPAQAAQAAQALLDELHEATAAHDSHLVRLVDEVDQYVEDIAARRDRPLLGITTGLVDLDKVTGGLQDGRFYTIAGRPGMGKSDVGTHLARAAATAGHPVLVTSIEMATHELIDRWLSFGSRLSSTTISRGQLGERDWELATAALLELQTLPIWIDDNPTSTLATIRADIRRSGARMVIVDYLQILDGPSGESRQIEVTALARGLKRLARDLNIPVIALAQLNRGVEGRQDKRPALSDLRESGAIEQESDVVISLYRDGAYNPDSDEAHVLELGLMKNRTGPNGIVVKVAYTQDVKMIANLAGMNP